MKETNKEQNIKSTQTQIIIKEGENIYNSLRNSDIRVYMDGFSGKLSLHDKRCLSLYLSILQNENFFKELMDEMNYQKFTNFSTKDTNSYHYEKEFAEFTKVFEMDNSLEVMVLYLLEYPLIKQLIIKEGYQVWNIKLAVYDYISNNIKNTIGINKNNQKVLTK